MRHLQYRNDFLNKKVQIEKENVRKNFKNSKIVKESVTSVTNDITFGGSLLGRLINSIIRKAGIYTKYAQINKPFADLKAAMDGLVESAALSPDLQKRTTIITFRALLTQIYNVVISNETVAIKITNLIGGGDEGLVGELLEALKKMKTEDFPERDELIKKLEKFRDLLKDIVKNEKIEPVEIGEKLEKDETKITEEDATRTQFEFYTSVKKLFQSIIGLEEQITNKRVIIEGEDTGKAYMLGKHKLTPGENYQYTNPGTKKTFTVKLISTEKELQSGPDGKFSKSIGVLKDGNVFVVSTTCLKCEGTGEVDIQLTKQKWRMAQSEVKKKFGENSKEYKDLVAKNDVLRGKIKNVEIRTCKVCNGNGKFDTAEEISKGIKSDGISKPFVANYKNLKWVPKETEKKPSAGGVTQPVLDSTEKQPASFWKNDFKFENHFYEMEMLPTEEKDFESFYFSLFGVSLLNEELNPVTGATKPGVGGISKNTPGFDKELTTPAVGRTNTNIINKDEKQAVAAWKKVLRVYNQKDVNLKELSAELKEIIKTSTVVPDPDKRKFKYEEFDNSKLILIGKEVVKNEATLGKPISFAELIKEKLEILTVAKHISLLARTLLGFKDDVGLASAYGLAGDHIKIFLNEYEYLKELYPDLVEYEKKSGEKVGVGKGVVKVTNKGKNENRLSDIYGYEKFRMFEELEDELEDDEEEGGGDDRVKDAWNKSFDKGDVDKYIISKKEQKEIDELGKETDASLSKEFNIDVNRNSTHKDYVMRIVNAFGRAYRLYATDYIPSGRPGGRVSLKTFREYKYIGGKDGRGGQWSGEQSTPGEGPYAIKMIFNAWQDKVTEMLEDNKYKEILQNAKFIYQGAVEGSGKTAERGDSDSSTRREIKVGRSLFDFINEMINPEGGFESSRRKIMKEWFGGVDVIKDENDKKQLNSGYDKYNFNNSLKSGGDGEEGQVSFFPIGHPNFKNSSFGKTAFDFFKKYEDCFFKIKYFENKKPLYLIGYVYQSKGDKVWIKYNKSEKGDKESIISTYLKNEKEDLKSFQENEKMKFEIGKDLFLGAIKMGDSIDIRGTAKTKIQEGKVIGSNKVGTVEDLEIDFESIQILVKNKDKTNVEKIVLGNPNLLSKDIDTLSNVLSSYADTNK